MLLVVCGGSNILPITFTNIEPQPGLMLHLSAAGIYNIDEAVFVDNNFVLLSLGQVDTPTKPGTLGAVFVVKLDFIHVDN